MDLPICIVPVEKRTPEKGLKGKGIGFVEAICKACPIPVYAIGGINLERLPQVRKAGAAGGCMMSGFMQLVKN